MTLDPAWSLTLHNAASSERTLRTMRFIAFLGMPLVVAYTVYVHRVFKGKVRLDEPGY